MHNACSVYLEGLLPRCPAALFLAPTLTVRAGFEPLCPFDTTTVSVAAAAAALALVGVFAGGAAVTTTLLIAQIEAHLGSAAVTLVTALVCAAHDALSAVAALAVVGGLFVVHVVALAQTVTVGNA